MSRFVTEQYLRRNKIVGEIPAVTAGPSAPLLSLAARRLSVKHRLPLSIAELIASLAGLGEQHQNDGAE